MMLAEQSQTWFPTHVQVTVLQAKHLKPKGKNGTNDTYTIIQMGREKYSTSVAEKTLDPIWKEEASFELPGLLLLGNPQKYVLSLIVMHRSLVGLDKFLGEVTISLNDIFENKQRRKTEWFKLESKTGKKAKDRGEIQVNIQFMRNNMTASMFDLSMKDKTRSPFAKLKAKMKGRKNDGTFSDTSSAIIPSTSSPKPDTDNDISEVPKQIKSKPKRTFLLGPQKLSSAHSMSDLMGSHSSVENLKSNTIGHAPVIRPQLDSVNSIEDSGSLNSPHRRSLSADASKVNQLDSTTSESELDLEAQSDPFANVSASLPQKYATLPKNRNPFENSSDSWENSNTISFSKQSEVKKENKKEKKEKTSLFERVTGKKESKKSDKLSNGKSDSFSELKSPNPFSENQQDVFEHDSRNPFATNLKNTNAQTWSSSKIMKRRSIEDIRTAVLGSNDRPKFLMNNQPTSKGRGKDGYPFDAAAAYHSLTYEEVIQELVKHKELLKKKDAHIRELEDYIDNLLVRVMEETPSILRVPYESSRKAGKVSKNK
ncbi:rab11 family-interacting protein 2 [Latimeria chalumnae]|uniref:rab11 family-interacting protein 2 n=1 Tax=Latimeria chalumnae TaxID=7897 RepID=UPI0006D8EA71|nr:PREDICTED: rab11 family-interacting protein 2 [Latimeria chalumnae]|eukprot:XP_014343732.1 PREDICTED: rab11 family-interacting protein 2 [Latimeria chalumnae]